MSTRSAVGGLFHFVESEIRDAVGTLEGEVVSRPVLVNRTDGSQLTYSVDVRISGYDQILSSVPLAMANKELIYAEAGCAVTLARNSTGKLEVTGFSKRKPGRRVRVAVDVAALLSGPPLDVTVTARPLTYEELGTLGGGYGTVPYGAFGLFRGGSLVEVRY